jgi:hypothetical protein
MLMEICNAMRPRGRVKLHGIRGIVNLCGTALQTLADTHIPETIGESGMRFRWSLRGSLIYPKFEKVRSVREWIPEY